MGMNFGGLFNGLSSAISSGNVANALSAATSLKSMLGTSNAVKQQIGMLTLQYEMNQPQSGQQPTPAQTTAMTQVVQSLVGLVPSLPAADGPLIQELGTPAIEANPAVAADVIGKIQQSLISNL
jgi:hypothetical protein